MDAGWQTHRQPILYSAEKPTRRQGENDSHVQ